MHSKTRNHRIADLRGRTPNHYGGRGGRWKAISNWVNRTIIVVCYKYLSANLPPDRSKRVILLRRRLVLGKKGRQCRLYSIQDCDCNLLRGSRWIKFRNWTGQNWRGRHQRLDLMIGVLAEADRTSIIWIKCGYGHRTPGFGNREGRARITNKRNGKWIVDHILQGKLSDVWTSMGLLVWGKLESSWLWSLGRRILFQLGIIASESHLWRIPNRH